MKAFTATMDAQDVEESELPRCANNCVSREAIRIWDGMRRTNRSIIHERKPTGQIRDGKFSPLCDMCRAGKKYPEPEVFSDAQFDSHLNGPVITPKGRGILRHIYSGSLGIELDGAPGKMERFAFGEVTV